MVRPRNYRFALLLIAEFRYLLKLAIMGVCPTTEVPEGLLTFLMNCRLAESSVAKN